MAHGGARIGAGRKKGAATKLNEVARAQALDGGISPLDYLLSVMRDDDNDGHTRLDAAKAAAPYVHAKLSAVDTTVKGPDGGAVVFQTVYMSKTD
jgi:hypothetical protein